MSIPGFIRKQIISMHHIKITTVFSFVGGLPIGAGMSAELYERGEGTIRYEGKWDLIDMFFVSQDMDEYSCMEIVRVPFLMKREKKHPGEKPFRTYSGPRYIGGVSDHCPIILWISDGNS